MRLLPPPLLFIRPTARRQEVNAAKKTPETYTAPPIIRLNNQASINNSFPPHHLQSFPISQILTSPIICPTGPFTRTPSINNSHFSPQTFPNPTSLSKLTLSINRILPNPAQKWHHRRHIRHHHHPPPRPGRPPRKSLGPRQRPLHRRHRLRSVPSGKVMASKTLTSGKFPPHHPIPPRLLRLPRKPATLTPPRCQPPILPRR